MSLWDQVTLALGALTTAAGSTMVAKSFPPRPAKAKNMPPGMWGLLTIAFSAITILLSTMCSILLAAVFGYVPQGVAAPTKEAAGVALLIALVLALLVLSTLLWLTQPSIRKPREPNTASEDPPPSPAAQATNPGTKHSQAIPAHSGLDFTATNTPNDDRKKPVHLLTSNISESTQILSSSPDATTQKETKIN